MLTKDCGRDTLVSGANNKYTMRKLRTKEIGMREFCELDLGDH